MTKIEAGGVGRQHYIKLVDPTAGTEATVFPQFGFNCASFRVSRQGKSYDLLYAEPGFPLPDSKATANGTPILIPFPNRIRDGKFHYGARDFQAPINHGPNAIHGFAFDWPWRVTRQEAALNGAMVRGEFQLSIDRPEYLVHWPADFRVACEYRLFGTSLATRFEIDNPSDALLPFGLGTHPYFRFPLGNDSQIEDCTIQSPAAESVELIECLPTGKVTPVPTHADLRKPVSWAMRNLDDVYTGLAANADGNIVHRLSDRKADVELQIVHPLDFKFSVVFVPPHRKAICIEPYTCVTDAINLGDSAISNPGLWKLRPGETRSLWIRYDVLFGPS